jgi:hypothetical protein
MQLISLELSSAETRNRGAGGSLSGVVPTSDLEILELADELKVISFVPRSITTLRRSLTN